MSKSANIVRIKKIAIADDEALFRKRMKLLLEYGDFGMKVAFEACDGDALLRQLRASETLPEVLLFGLNMPALN